MRSIAGIYGLNALAFVSNLAAVFVFLRLAGPEGYGTYGIYIVFLAAYFLWDISVVKAALLIREEDHQNGVAKPDRRAVAFVRASVILVVVGSLVLGVGGNSVYPVDSATLVGGRFVALIVAGEHILGYPANRLVYHLTFQGKFRTIYSLRLGSTLLRHAFSWITLLFTGSVAWALAAIVLKGLTLGAISAYWTKQQFNIDESAGFRISRAHLALACSLFAAAFAVVVMQEIPSVYIDRGYGREALGSYRSFYDIIAAVWFVASIYPTLLFAKLLRSRGTGGTQKHKSFVAFWGLRLCLFHLVYFCVVSAGVIAGILWQITFLSLMPYFVGVTGGVAILGYSRYLVEVAQAQGLSRNVFGSTLGAILVVFLVLLILPGTIGMLSIGMAWLVGQTAFFLFLKLSLLLAKAQGISDQWDFLILVVPILLLCVMHSLVSVQVLLAICMLVAAAGSAALIVLMLQVLQSHHRSVS